MNTPPTTRWFLNVLLVVMLGIIAYFFFYFFTRTCCAPPPRERAFSNARVICEAEGGFFIEALEACELPASDAGKICSDSSDCEGLCKAKPSPEEISAIAAGNRIKTSGACSATKNFFSGCFYVVEEDVVERLCAD